MKVKNYTGLIPGNTEGKEITAEAFADFTDAFKAKTFFKVAAERLSNVNDWNKIAGGISAIFQLTNENGEPVHRVPKKGDHFRIEIPVPANSAGKGFDWARVEDIRQINTKNVDSMAIIVYPASNPATQDREIAHFYAPGSSSTFVVTREGHVVSASIYDRNIKVNKTSGGFIDKIRNAIVGVSAEHGFSKLQWQLLAEALVQKD
jgi:hypothetical protein